MYLNKIKGYNELSAESKKTFDRVYADHQAIVEDKKNWSAISVIDREIYLEVHFQNGFWLHFTADGSWY